MSNDHPLHGGDETTSETMHVSQLGRGAVGILEAEIRKLKAWGDDARAERDAYMKSYHDCVRERDALRETVRALAEALESTANYLEDKARGIDEYVSKQRAEFDKWVKRQHSENKTLPVGAMELDAEYMRQAAKFLQAALAKARAVQHD